MREARPTGRGPGRLLVAVYAVFALSATSRALYQLLAKFSDAPVAYLLSAVAAVVYCVATYALLRDERPLALGTIAFELAGVLAVGTLTVADRSLFPDSTVWSQYGQGYGFVPLVLPVVGLLWLRRTSARA